MHRRTFLALPLAGLARGQSALPDFYKRVTRLQWVTPDAAALAEAWRKLGATPLGTTESTEVGGGTIKAVTAQLGQLLVDWIQPLGGQSVFSRFLEANRGPGVFGLAHRVPTVEALQAEVARLAAVGVAPAVQGKIETDSGRTLHYSILDTRREGLYHLTLACEPEPQLPPAAASRTVTQFALVTRQPEKVSAYWAKMGFPAFTYSTVNARDPLYRGKPGTFDMRLGWQRHGSVPFEWIEPLKGPSTYHDHIARHGDGFHHLAFGVPDMDKAIEEWRGYGYEVSMSGAWGEKDKPGSGRFAYIDTSKDGGIEVELLWNYRAG